MVKKVLQKIEESGFQGFVVGGGVRDLLMNASIYDWDFTTNAKPEQIQKIFPESFYDNKFGTVGITAQELADQFNLKNHSFKEENIKPEDVFEITTFRSEGIYSDKRHPDKVTWGKNLEEDLKRRDFTINAMALSLEKNNWKIIDPFKGRQDLKNKLIRAVGDPNKRFAEDGLRMMRAIRIATQLNFSLEEKTLQAIVANAALISQISNERIRDELFKIIKSDYPSDGVKMLFSSGLLEFIIPELVRTRGVEQAGHHTKDVWNHSLDSLKESPSKDKIVRLATLLHDIGKPIAYRKQNNKITFYGHEVVGEKITRNIAQRLKLSKKDSQRLISLVRHHMFIYTPKMTDKAIKRFIKRVGKENINDMIMLRIGDRKGGGSKATSWRLRELQQRIGELMYSPLEIKDLKVDGRDVMKVLNIKPGPKVGQTLEHLFEEVLEDDQKNNREYLLKRIKELKKEL